jgi:hypothetical protein
VPLWLAVSPGQCTIARSLHCSADLHSVCVWCDQAWYVGSASGFGSSMAQGAVRRQWGHTTAAGFSSPTQKRTSMDVALGMHHHPPPEYTPSTSPWTAPNRRCVLMCCRPWLVHAPGCGPVPGGLCYCGRPHDRWEPVPVARALHPELEHAQHIAFPASASAWHCPLYLCGPPQCCTGAALNPARVLGPLAVFGCGAEYAWVFILAQLTAALVACFIFGISAGFGPLFPFVSMRKYVLKKREVSVK